MSLIRKFDPRIFRSNAPSAQVRPFVEPAKVAKAAKVEPSASLSSANFSKFSSFSRTSSGSGDPDETWSGDDWQAYFEERAAIREYAGGLRRDEAERLALEDAITHWLCLNPVPASDPRCGCIYCNTGEQAFNCLVPVLTVGGHVWVHNAHGPAQVEVA